MSDSLRLTQVREFYESDVVISTFNRAFAGRWHVAVRPSAAGVETSEQALARLLDLSPQHELLDLGSGVGATTCELALATGCRARGVNISAKQVQGARLLAERLGLTGRVDFDLYAGIELPYEGGSFDRAVFLESMCHIPHKPLMFAELARVLRPGGILAGQDWVLTDAPLSAADRAEYVEPIESATAVKLASLADYRRWMLKAGFTGVHALDARDIDPGLARAFPDPPDAPVVVLPEDDLAARLWKGAQALRRAFHRGLFTIGFVHGVAPARARAGAVRAACALLPGAQIGPEAYSARKNAACIALHQQAFQLPEPEPLVAFTRLVAASEGCSLEPSVKLDHDGIHAQRYNLFHHAGDHAAFLASVLALFEELSRGGIASFELEPVRQLLAAGLDLTRVQKVVTGLDLRDDARRSRAKLWFMLEDAPACVERAIELQGTERGFIDGLRFHAPFLVGFDLGFAGQTRVKLYPDVEPSELGDPWVRGRLRGVLPPAALEAMEQCVWTHLYCRGPGEELVLQLHPADPDAFVARYVPRALRDVVHVAYAGTDLLDMVVAIPVGELDMLPATRCCLYYMPNAAPCS